MPIAIHRFNISTNHYNIYYISYMYVFCFDQSTILRAQGSAPSTSILEQPLERKRISNILDIWISVSYAQQYYRTSAALKSGMAKHVRSICQPSIITGAETLSLTSGAETFFFFDRWC